MQVRDDVECSLRVRETRLVSHSPHRHQFLLTNELGVAGEQLMECNPNSGGSLQRSRTTNFRKFW